MAPADLHLTVAFLGPVEEAAAFAAFEIAAGYKPAALGVRLDVVIPLGNPRRPSALGAGLGEGKEKAIALLSQLRDPLADAAGARRETRPPLPHVTLARPARRARPEERSAAVQWAQALDLGAPRVSLEQLALYTWAEDRSGPRKFRIVRAVALR